MVMEKNEELVVVPKNLEMLQRDDLETFFEDLKRLQAKIREICTHTELIFT